MEFHKLDAHTYQADVQGRRINAVELSEQTSEPSASAGAIRAYHMDALEHGVWRRVYTGDIVGAYRLCLLPAVRPDAVRLVVDRCEGEPALVRFNAVRLPSLPAKEPFRRVGYIHPAAFTSGELLFSKALDALTHVIFVGFARWNTDKEGMLRLIIDERADDHIRRLKECIGQRPVRILLALTNGCVLDDFDTVERRASLVDTAMEFVEKHSLDGIDIDNEYPYTGKGWTVYGGLLLDFRRRLAGTGKTLSIAVGLWNHHLTREASEAVDQFNIMSYDDGHDYSYWHSTFGFFNREIQSLESAFIPREKANAGMPFYGLYHDKNGRSCEMSKSYAELYAMQEPFDASRNNLGDFYFNGPVMIRDKTAHAMMSGCGGLMIWQIAGDLPFENPASLLHGAYSVVRRFTASS